MKSYTHDELLELLPAYALGALSAEETAAVDAALRPGTDGADALRRELRAFEEVATQMASANPIVPPAAAKERLFARVSASKQATIPSAPRAPGWLVGALAASLMIAAGLAGYTWSLRDTLTQREATLNAILEADRELRVARVVADDSTNGAGIQVFWNAKQQRGILHAFHMKQAPAGRAYQVWVLQDGKPVSAGVFNTDAEGHAIVDDITVPASLTASTLVLITEEPAGGSPGPTTQPFMRGELPR